MTDQIPDPFPEVAATCIWEETACAKINLGLKVLNPRPDGYHEIRTIMQTVDLADTLYFSPAERPGLSCTDKSLSVGPDNLVLQAAARFNARFPGGQTFHIHLEKKIPYGAGLGGGSADAAATLRALNHLHGAPLGLSQLEGLAAALGSDVPFLIRGGTALARGRGEVLEPLVWQAEAVYYVLVYPGVAVATAWAYAHLTPALTASSSYLSLLGSLGGGCVVGADLFQVLENDFQALVERTNPIVAAARGQLKQAGAFASSMSGSGSTIYGIFDDRLAALHAQRALQAHGFRSFFCVPTPPVSGPGPPA